jgi:LytS/YehU family sensor histidine kinase
MTVASFVPHSLVLASTDDDTVPAPDTVWRRYRPIAVALPPFMLLSYFAWLHDSPPELGPLPLATWFVLCFAGSFTPVATFGFAMRVSDKRPLVGGLSWRSIAVHALAVLACFGINALTHAIVSPRSPIPVRPYTPGHLLLETVLEYLVFAFAFQAVRTIREGKKAELARIRLRADLMEAGQRRAEAELRALKAELNPHFLGNALQGVKALMRTDVDAADSVVSSLAGLLRTTLTRAGTQETTLREEIETLGPFIHVERARLRGRLDVLFEIDDSTLDLLVPDMILQPLVENAVKHGLIPFGGGRIRIAARPAPADTGSVEITVEDDGVALGSVGTTRSSKQGGVGLTNIRARLAELYANHARLELTRGGLGTLVRVTLPSRHADTAEPLGTEVDEAPRSMAETSRAARSVRFRDATWAARGWRVMRFGATLGLWVFWMANNAASNTSTALARGYHDKQPYAVVDGAIVGTLLVAMVYFAVWLSRRVPIPPPGPKKFLSGARAVLVSLAGGMASAATICLVKGCVAVVFHYWEILQPSHLVLNLLRSMIAINLFFLSACALAQFYFAFKRSHAARANRHRMGLELADTRRRRAEAELRALKSELNPHFVGNALNAVSVLMRTDPRAASRVIDQLSDLLGTAVDRAGTQEVTLREELESLQPFLAVERIRLGQDLDVTLDVDDQALDCPVPHMILQTLVENAVKHGFALRNHGLIEVHAHRSERHLELMICDDGVGLSTEVTSPIRATGTGLANARARLSKLYGQSASLELSSVPGGGAVARVLVPWHEPAEVALAASPSVSRNERTFTRHPASTVGVAGSP